MRRLGWVPVCGRVPRRLPAALLAAGLLLGAARTQAQVPLRFELGAGAAFPSSPGIANEYWDAGYTLSAGARWRLSPHWNLGLDIGFARFGRHENGAVPDSTFGQGGELNVVPILLAGEFVFSDWSNTRPFVSAHAGYIRVRTSDVTGFSSTAGAAPPQQPDIDAFGLGFGIGVRTLLTASADLVVEVGWRMAIADPDAIAWIPARVAIRF